MKPENETTDFPDEFKTWNEPVSHRPTEAFTHSNPEDQELTIPVESTGGDRSASSNPTTGSDDTGDQTPISSLQGGSSSQDLTTDWDLVPPPIFEPGNLVFGKYKLIKLIGEGGMGQVWLVENIQLDCQSALKLIKPEIAKSDKAWKRFKREAQVMAKLNHPNAIVVRDFARAQSVAYIEMEFVRGVSLDKAIDEQGHKPFGLEWVAPIVEQACSVLQEAHEHVDERTGKARPIIHRDLKPSNLMLVSRKPVGQNLKVLDFGIAKMADDERDSKLTGDMEYVGTAAYSSPEQIRSETIDGRSDIYSFGVILYQFLTGDLPFKGGPRRALVAHLMEPPRPFREANPEANVPESIEKLVLQCLEKDMELRPRSARELSERFREALSLETGFVVKPKAPRSLVVPVAAIALAAVVATVAVVVATRSGKKTVEPTPEVAIAKPDTAKISNVEPTAAPRWKLPAGFRAAGDGINDPDGPKTIQREVGRVSFQRQKSGNYLPEGFVTIDDDGESNGWPNTISRGSDASLMRFRRLPMGTFHMGQVKAATANGDAAAEDASLPDDLQVKPIVPHWVELTGFYILETEVTNGQIEAFLKEKPGLISEDALSEWRRNVSELLPNQLKLTGSDLKETNRFPAILLDRKTAATFAESIGGLLPTEAQWEYTARSGGEPRLFATQLPIGRLGKPKANLSGSSTDSMVERVKSYDNGKDETNQSIFDMTGNVREWCRDVYRPDAEIVGESTKKDWFLRDPCIVDSHPTGEVKYVVRGGSFLTDAADATTIQRDALAGTERVIDLGFRVVIECPILTLNAAP